MKIFSIYPSEDSEKAISNYTKQLIIAQEAQGLDINPIEYTAGNYSTLDLFHVRRGDVVHIQHEYNLFGKFGLPFFKFYKEFDESGVKIITTMHNVLSKNHKFKGNPIKTILRKQLYKYQNRAIEKGSDLVIVHAEFFKKILVDEYDFPEEKVMVLRQGILEDVKLMQKNKAKKQLNLKGNVFLIIGSLVPDHGADEIVKHAKEIGGTIVIAASDKAINDRNDNRQEIWFNHLKELSHIHQTDNVKFRVMDLPYSLWWKYFAAADIVLLPYKAGIGSGIFADCIATKTPMVGSDIEYFREFAKDWSFIDIAYSEFDYEIAVRNILEENKSIIETDFNNYTKKYGMTALAKKYKEIYKNE